MFSENLTYWHYTGMEAFVNWQWVENICSNLFGFWNLPKFSSKKIKNDNQYLQQTSLATWHVLIAFHRVCLSFSLE